jgi:hypothetical protein
MRELERQLLPPASDPRRTSRALAHCDAGITIPARTLASFISNSRHLSLFCLMPGACFDDSSRPAGPGGDLPPKMEILCG